MSLKPETFMMTKDRFGVFAIGLDVEPRTPEFCAEKIGMPIEKVLKNIDFLVSAGFLEWLWLEKNRYFYASEYGCKQMCKTFGVEYLPNDEKTRSIMFEIISMKYDMLRERL